MSKVERLWKDDTVLCPLTNQDLKGYEPCTSAFFVASTLNYDPANKADGQWKRFDAAALSAAMEESGALEYVSSLAPSDTVSQGIASTESALSNCDHDLEVAESPGRIDIILARCSRESDDFLTRAKRKRDGLRMDRMQRGREEYRQAFDDADTVEELERVIERYGDFDPDGLIPNARAQLFTLKSAECADRYRASKSTAELEAFIDACAKFDKDQLVTDARKRVAAAQAAAHAAEVQAAAKRAHADRLRDLEQQIRQCSAQIDMSQKAIFEENEVGAISGVVDQGRLHVAGSMIVGCRKRIERDFAQYQSLGGTKALVDLQKYENAAGR